MSDSEDSPPPPEETQLSRLLDEYMEAPGAREEACDRMKACMYELIDLAHQAIAAIDPDEVGGLLGTGIGRLLSKQEAKLRETRDDVFSLPTSVLGAAAEKYTAMALSWFRHVAHHAANAGRVGEVLDLALRNGGERKNETAMAMFTELDTVFMANRILSPGKEQPRADDPAAQLVCQLVTQQLVSVLYSEGGLGSDYVTFDGDPEIMEPWHALWMVLGPNDGVPRDAAAIEALNTAMAENVPRIADAFLAAAAAMPAGWPMLPESRIREPEEQLLALRIMAKNLSMLVADGIGFLSPLSRARLLAGPDAARVPVAPA